MAVVMVFYSVCADINMCSIELFLGYENFVIDKFREYWFEVEQESF